MKDIMRTLLTRLGSTYKDLKPAQTLTVTVNMNGLGSTYKDLKLVKAMRIKKSKSC